MSDLSPRPGAFGEPGTTSEDRPPEPTSPTDPSIALDDERGDTVPTSPDGPDGTARAGNATSPTTAVDPAGGSIDTDVGNGTALDDSTLDDNTSLPDDRTLPDDSAVSNDGALSKDGALSDDTAGPEEGLRSGDPQAPGSERAPEPPAVSSAPVGSDDPAPEPLGVGGRPLPRVIAVANQKGGVGKTTTTVNMGVALAELDFRTLVIDLDPQGNATTGLGINYRMLDHTMYDVLLHDVPLEDCIEPTEVRNLFVAPASLDLAGAEIELVPAFSRETRLKRAVAEIIDDYDYILIDCPPSLGLLTVNGLVAATEVMVPIQCEYYALEGLAQLTRNVDLVRTNLNPELEISGIVMVMYDSRTRLAEQVVSEVRGHFGPKVCRNMIPRNIRLSEAPSYGQPITTFDPSSRGAVAYRELAREVSGGS